MNKFKRDDKLVSDRYKANREIVDILSKLVDIHKANREIVDILSKLVDIHKDDGLRFFQLLHAYDIISSSKNSDKFYEESIDSLRNIKELLKDNPKYNEVI